MLLEEIGCGMLHLSPFHAYQLHIILGLTDALLDDFASGPGDEIYASQLLPLSAGLTLLMGPRIGIPFSPPAIRIILKTYLQDFEECLPHSSFPFLASLSNRASIIGIPRVTIVTTEYTIEHALRGLPSSVKIAAGSGQGAAWDWLRCVAGWVHPAPAAVRERPRGVVLLSPFSKLETLLDTYYILGLVPLFAPLRTISYLSRFMIHRFNSLAKVVSLKAPLLIVHAEDDLDIPVWHAQMLFDAFLEKHLPPLPEITPEMMPAITEEEDAAPPPDEVAESVVALLLQEREVRRRELVRVREMERVGRVKVFSKDRADGEVVFLHTRWGAHDVGLVEGVQDFMAEMFNMGASSARKSI
ncbi:hypothetical protein BJY52DRAFT_1419415 [Lactarius psammicola]|nr:hypothetical protein BJY52DRAFT_1419415 [Lactarius psammicola]